MYGLFEKTFSMYSLSQDNISLTFSDTKFLFIVIIAFFFFFFFFGLYYVTIIIVQSNRAAVQAKDILDPTELSH